MAYMQPSNAENLKQAIEEVTLTHLDNIKFEIVIYYTFVEDQRLFSNLTKYICLVLNLCKLLYINIMVSLFGPK